MHTYRTYAITPTDHISVANVIASKFTTSGATNCIVEEGMKKKFNKSTINSIFSSTKE